ncbi:MAG: heavy metal-binding domain-containing protein [Ktedonobacterales bacterium]
MITATLSSLPSNRPYHPVGVVAGISEVPPGPQALETALHQMEAQAEAMGADAIIDVRLQMAPVPMMSARPGPGFLAISLIGTAIKYT